MAIREGKWKCPGCGEINRGAVTQCGSCGATRDANVKFFLDDDAPEVQDAKLLERAKAGADWVCAFCDNANPAPATACQGCGAPRAEGKEKKHGDVIPVATTAAAGAMPTGTTSRVPILVVFLAFLGLCVPCGLFGWFMGRSHKDSATVTQARWERSIGVEAIRAVQETAWDAAPAGARDVTQKREIKEYREVQRGTKTEYRDEKVQTGTRTKVVGKRDLGNGFFEDVTEEEPVYETRRVPHEVPNMVKEPVYAQKFSFTIDRWVEIRRERAEGTTDPRWPDPGLGAGEREGRRDEKYELTFKAEKLEKPKLVTVSTADAFARYAVGSKWEVEWSRTGAFKVLDASGKPAVELTAEAEGRK